MKKDKRGKIVKDKKAESNYILKLADLLKLQAKYRKLEEEDKLCSICLSKPLKEKSGIFCENC
jgi:hypothetical protein